LAARGELNSESDVAQAPQAQAGRRKETMLDVQISAKDLDDVNESGAFSCYVRISLSGAGAARILATLY